MKIFISSSFFRNRKIISDEMNEPKIDLNEPIQLLFIDGSVTISLFKQLYLAGIDAFFVVRNIEFFMFKMRQFKHMNYQIIKNENSTRKYSELLHEKDAISTDLSKMVEKYVSVEKKLRSLNDKNIDIDSDMGEIKKGISVSFRPKIIDSIRSSFENSQLYLSENQNCHLIYKRLKESKCTIEEIEKVISDKLIGDKVISDKLINDKLINDKLIGDKVIGDNVTDDKVTDDKVIGDNVTDNKESIHRTLKSMIFAGIVIKKGDYVQLNDILTM